MTGKYLKEEEIRAILGTLAIDPSFVPMSQDTYNETAVLEAISKTKRVTDLLMATINMSCIGYGGQKYGLYKLKDEVKDIGVVLKDCGVKLALPRDSKLLETELTPQRLCRAFRHQIRDYIRKNNFETYLYRKYSTHDPRFADICFRGAEYLDGLTQDEVDYLLDIYGRLDKDRKITVLDRIKRVFQAKGYMKRQVEVD